MTVTIPHIDGIPFRNALIIDNRQDEIEELKNDLEDRGISVIYVNNSEDAKKLIKHKPEINFIIIDWFLNEEDSMESKLFITNLSDYLFVPIIIYTKQGMIDPTNFVEERDLGRIVRVLDKTDVNGELIFEEMEQWVQENPELKIFLKWSFEVEKNLNQVLWKIYSLETDGLKSLIGTIKADEDASYMPVEYDLVGIFIKVLLRKLHDAEKLLKSISGNVCELLDESAPLDPKKMEMFHTFERYISPPVSGPIWTGDILTTSDNEYFVIVTPTCDLCNNKIDNVLLLGATPFGKYRIEKSINNEKAEVLIKNKTDVSHYLPYVPDCPDGLLCRFDNISYINIKDIKNEIIDEKYIRIATIDSPFIENLIQRMNAYLMRLGVRDLGKEEVKMIKQNTKLK